MPLNIATLQPIVVDPKCPLSVGRHDKPPSVNVVVQQAGTSRHKQRDQPTVKPGQKQNARAYRVNLLHLHPACSAFSQDSASPRSVNIFRFHSVDRGMAAKDSVAIIDIRV